MATRLFLGNSFSSAKAAGESPSRSSAGQAFGGGAKLKPLNAVENPAIRGDPRYALQC
jgi:hypothetical protein